MCLFQELLFFPLKETDWVFYLKHSNGNIEVKTLLLPSYNIQVRKVPLLVTSSSFGASSFKTLFSY